MTGLLSLSNELLIHVFGASDSIQDALNFSTVNHQLRAIWLEHRDQILESILRSSIPAYDEALETAALETQLQSSLDNKPPLRGCLSTLLRNADLCASAHVACVEFLQQKGSSTPVPATYHIIRRMMLAQEFPQLRDDVLRTLQPASEGTLKAYCSYIRFLNEYAEDEEQARQGMVPEKTWPDPLRTYDEVIIDGWDYIQDALYAALSERQGRKCKDYMSKAIYCQHPFQDREWRPEIPALIKGTQSEPMSHP